MGTPGTPDFFLSLLEYIRTIVPSFPLDPVIFQSVILCLMAGNKHLLLRTREEDIPIVHNLAALIFTNILGCTTHKHKIASSSGILPQSFVPSIFASSHQGAPSPTGRLASSSKVRAKRPRSHPISEGHGRVASEPNASPSETSASQRERQDAKSRPPLRPLFHLTGERSDPSGSTEPDTPWAQRRSGNSLLPTALVLTGLEHASAPCQRALLRTLLENRVPFDEDLAGSRSSFWELPEGFTLVYVCPFDPRERPSIHKSLLDKFSLSVAVALHPSTREAYRTYLGSHFSNTQTSTLSSTPTQLANANSVLSRNIFSRLTSLSTPAHVNIHPSLRLYIADLIAAARHHHELDGTLLGLHCVQDAEAFVRAHRVLGAGDAGSVPVERPPTLSLTSAAGSTSSLPHGAGGNLNVHLHWVDAGSSVTSSASRPASVTPDVEKDWLHVDPREKWDVSEVDVAKIVPRVISHRLRVRDGPEDEMMSGVMFTTTTPRVPTGVENKEGVWRRRTVKEILVKLMTQV